MKNKKNKAAILDQKRSNIKLNFSSIRLVENQEIIKSVNFLRRDIKSKDFVRRIEILTDKSQELIRLGFTHTDPSTRVSSLALQLLERSDPTIKSKSRIEESDWKKNRVLLFNSVIPVPQKRTDKAPITWESQMMEIKRIPDKRGTDSKIEVNHPEIKDQKIKTPWYPIPNVIDFEISDKLGYNAALLLVQNQISRAKSEEAYLP